MILRNISYLPQSPRTRWTCGGESHGSCIYLMELRFIWLAESRQASSHPPNTFTASSSPACRRERQCLSIHNSWRNLPPNIITAEASSLSFMASSSRLFIPSHVVNPSSNNLVSPLAWWPFSVLCLRYCLTLSSVLPCNIWIFASHATNNRICEAAMVGWEMV